MTEKIILGIESSCDETGVAIYSDKRGILANKLNSQVKIHADYGGVVPEIASRDHLRQLIPLIDQALSQAKISGKQLSAIAYTKGPGLAGALLTGATVAKSLAFSWKINTIAINHLEAHILVAMLEAEQPKFPFLALLVSGGHTQLIFAKALADYQVLGDSLDDAVGEAFDKTAKILGLGYPGGAELAKLAEHGQPKRWKFSRPMVNKPGYDFSFSGLKTQVLNTWNNSNQTQQDKVDIASSFEQAVVDTLVIKCQRALQQTTVDSLVIAGGVSANIKLRHRIKQVTEKLGKKAYFPRLEFCTDNGVMIAYAGYLYLQQEVAVANIENHSLSIEVKPRWSLDSLADEITC